MRKSTDRSRQRERWSGESHPGHDPSHSLSYTPLSVHSLPRSQPLVSIPHTPIGLFDTTKWVLPFPCEPDDLDALRAGSDWKEHEHLGGKDKRRGRTIRQYGGHYRFTREKDGCHTVVSGRKITVTAGFPAIVGWDNDSQWLMSEEDDLLAFRSLTSDLFPATTVQAESEGCSWHGTRIDLAVNGRGNIRDAIEAYRHAQRPRSPGRGEVHTETGIAWYGDDYATLVYDPDQRPPRGMLRRLLRDRSFPSSKSGADQVRVEHRFNTPRAIMRGLLPYLEPASDGLPFLVTARGAPRVVRFRPDHHRLHQLVASEFARLGATGREVSAGGTSDRKLLGHFGLKYLALFPEELRHIGPPAYSKRAARQIRREVTQVSVGMRNIDLVQKLWNRPRPDPVMRDRLFCLQQSWSRAPLVE